MMSLVEQNTAELLPKKTKKIIKRDNNFIRLTRKGESQYLKAKKGDRSETKELNINVKTLTSKLL